MTRPVFSRLQVLNGKIDTAAAIAREAMAAGLYDKAKQYARLAVEYAEMIIKLEERGA